MTTTHKTTGRPRHFLPVQAVAGLVISVAGNEEREAITIAI